MLEFHYEFSIYPKKVFIIEYFNSHSMVLRLLTKLAILFLFSIVFVSDSEAQQKPFYQKSKLLTFIYKLSDTAKPESNFYQHFLSALNPLQKTDKTIVTVTLKEWVKLFRKDNMVSVQIEFSDVQICCDSTYHGMNVKNELMPEKILCNVFVLNKKTSSSFPFTNQTQLVMNGKISFTAGTIKGKVKADYQPDVKDVQLLFTDEQMATLDKRLLMIDEYYSTAKELVKMIPLSESITTTDIEKIPEQRTKLAKADSLLNMMEEIPFSFSLELEKNDPAGMVSLFKQLKEICASKHTEMDHLVAELPKRYYDNGMKNVRLGKTSEAKKYFTLSLSLNPDYSQSLLQLALFDKATGKITDAEEKAKTILLKQKPDAVTAAAALSIVDQKLQRLTDRIAELLHTGKETDALAKVSEAEQYLALVPMLKGDKVKDLKLKCYQSGYGRILTASRASLSLNQYDKAEKQVRDAIQYQLAHAEFISSSADANSLLQNILIKRYNLMVQTGKTELLNKHFDKAMQAFDDAIEYQVKYKLTANGDASVLKLRAERSVITDIIQQALAASAARRMGEAKKIAMKAIDTARDRQLENDSDLSPKLRVLRETVFSKECLSAQSNYNEWHKTGKIAEAQKDFMGAHAIYARAQNYFNDYRECSLDAENIDKDLEYINPPFMYQSMMLDIHALEDKQNYVSAVYKYKEATNYYSEQKIPSYGLLHPHLADFAIDNCSDAFINYLTKYFLEKDEADKALLLYKTLVAHKYYAKHTISPGLFNLGESIGWRDHMKETNGKPKDLAKDYVSPNSDAHLSEASINFNDKMYRPFVKGYVHGWKRVK